MVDPLRFAFIGCSNIAQRHAEALSRLDGAQLVAVCDLVEARAQAFGEKYGVRYYTDYHKMLDADLADVVTILTPSGDHAERVLDVVQYQRHIVVEKPLAL